MPVVYLTKTIQRIVRSISTSAQFSVFFSLFLLLFLPCLVISQEHDATVFVPAQGEDYALALSPSERDWLKAHPAIILGYADSQEPQLIVNPDGSYSGIVVDLLHELNRRLGTAIQLEAYPVQELIKKGKNGEIDGICNLHPEYAKRLNMLQTKGYFQNYPAIFARKDLVFNGPSDIYGKTVAIIDKAFFSEKIVQKYKDQVVIKRVKSALGGLQSLESGEADIFIGVSHNSYLVSKYQLYDIAAKYIYTDYADKTVVAIRSDWPQLVEILNKGLSTFSDADLNATVAKWVKGPEQNPRPRLTVEERNWLAQHPNIELGYTDAFEPAVIVNEDGSYRGTLVDILKLLNQRLGTDIKLTIGPVPDVLRQVTNKELAGVLSLHPKYADKLGWLKTKHYMNSYPTVFAKKGFTFTGSSDLAGKKIAIIDKVFFSQNLVDLYGEGATLVKVSNAREGLERVKDGTVDLYIGSSRNSYLLSKYQFFDLVASFQFYEHPTPNVMAVRNDWPELVAILNKGLAAISFEEIESILRKWVSVPEPKKTIQLSEEERDWLDANSRIRVGVSPIPPYMFSENGKAQGYLVDMMERLISQVGLTAEYSMRPLTENLSGVKSGELHTILGMLHSEERAGFMYFSDNTMKMQMAIFTRTVRSGISDASSLAGKVIASYKGYGFEPVIKKYLPHASIVRADDTEGMLRLVASGEADAAVQELHSGEYILRDGFINSVSRKGSFAPSGMPLLTGSEFGVSKKFPLLYSILNKSYNAFPESEKNRVWRKWFANVPEQEKTIELTDEERAYIAEHPTVQFGFMVEYDPYLMVDETGLQSGILVDLGAELSRKLGIDIEIQGFKTIPDLMKASEAKAIDVLYAILPQRAEKRGLLQTDIYLHSYISIYTRDGERVTTPDDMVGKSVSLAKDAAYLKLFVEPYLEKLTVVPVNTPADGLRMLAEGQVDMYVGSSTHKILLNKYRIGGVSQAYIHTEEGMPFVMGIRPDRPELVSILNKGLASLGKNGIDDIVIKWLRTPEQEEAITLSTEEKAWLNQNHTVRVRAVDWPPYLIIKENELPQGIAIEYLKLISKRTGINFEYEVGNQPFAEFLESMKQRRGIDMTALIVQDVEREQYVSFSVPYLSSPYVIFAREKEETFLDINGLTGKTLAVPRGSIMQHLLERDFPDIRLVLFDNNEQALHAVSTGKVGAYIGNLTVSSHIIQKRGLSNLRVVASTPYGDQVLSMGNRNDWPELTSIIDKAMASITEEEKTTIRNKYTALRYEQGIDRALVVRWVLILGITASAMMVLFIIWNRQLRLQVRVRTADLETEIVERKQVANALRDSEEKFRYLVEQSPTSIQVLNIDGTVVKVNQAWMDLWGISEEVLPEILAKYNIFEDEAVKSIGLMPLVEKAFKGERVTLPVVEYDADSTMQKLEVRNKSAHKRWVQMRLYPIRNSQGTIINIIGIEENLTEQKRAEDALHRNFAYLEHVTGTVADAIYSVKMPDRIIEWANDSYQVMGFDQKECIGHSTKIFYSNELEYQSFGKSLADAIEAGDQVLHVEANLRRKNGDLFSGEISTTIYRENDEVVSVTSLIRDITKRKQVEEEIKQYQERLKSLASQLTVVEEAERRRIAAGLHDHIGQILAFARIQLAKAKKYAPDNKQFALLDDISQSILRVIEDTKALIFDLSSPLLNELGLDAAVTDWLENQVKKRYGLNYTYTLEGLDFELSELEQVILFRNFKELILNVVKHAQASTIDVRLSCNEQQLFLTVSDNGVGFDPQHVSEKTSDDGGFGLFSIQERMAEMSGALSLVAEKGQGCIATLSLPVDFKEIEIDT